MKENFLTPIRRTNLASERELLKKPSKATATIKEDRQAFGTILSQSSSIEDDLAYPVTTYTLSIAFSDGTLRQTKTKSSLRNFLINEATYDAIQGNHL